MNRPYPTYSPGTRRAAGVDAYAETDVIEDYDGYDAEDDVYEYVEPLDRRWMWVAGAAGAVLLVAVICTVVILGGGDSGSVSATVSPPSVTTSPAATSQAPSRAPSMPAPAPLPTGPLTPETVTTVAPSPSAEAAPPPEAAPSPAPAPNTITYQVTGSRQLIDLVTVIYTDGQGALQTELNVALPWSKSVVLDPGVTLGSVTATSVMGHLNCTITDAAGAVVAAQANNTLIANCTK